MHVLLSGKPKRAIMFVPPHPLFSSSFCVHQPKWESQQLWPGWTLKDKASPSMQFMPFCQTPFAVHSEECLLLQLRLMPLYSLQVCTHHGEAVRLPGWTDQG